MSAPLTSIELFAGAGGLALGAEEAGFQHAALVEWDRDASETLRQRPGWRGAVVEGDVRDVDFRLYGGVDVVAGGPPCQSFSTAGHRGLGQDPKNMFPSAIRAVKEARPRAVLLENVTGLVKGGRARGYFALVRAQLRALGYRVEWRVVNAADHGVPQVRQRVITVAFRRDVRARFGWPQPEWPRPTLREALAGLPPRPAAQLLRCEKGIVQEHRMDAPAWTITATGWSGKLLRMDDGRLRYLTIRELARLQTFPDSWRFVGSEESQLRQIGNAVPVGLARALARSVAAALGGADERQGAA